MINWKQKLSSRKLWAMIAAFVAALLVIFRVPEPTIEQIIALITAVGVVIAYVLAEGKIDAARETARKER